MVARCGHRAALGRLCAVTVPQQSAPGARTTTIIYAALTESHAVAADGHGTAPVGASRPFAAARSLN